jgi:hypothetical protein
MDQLTKFLVRELVDGKSVTAIYGGGFKPPTKGHFDLVKTALKDFKDIDKFLIYVGGGIRDGIEQEQSLQVWDIYKELLPSKVQIEPSPSPIGDILRYAKNHPDEKVYFLLGYREGREDDLQDIKNRTKGVEEKYPNLEVRVIKSPGGDMSGTNARKALKKGDKETFFTYLPDEIPANEKEDIYNILEPNIFKENVAPNHKGKAAPFGSGYKPLKENTIPSIDILDKIAELTLYMREKGYNIDPVPGITIIDNDVENAGEFLGKTAYYNPINKSITLYTYGRHPKDIVRSFAHEMIHHIQNLEGRLGDVSTTNTLEDDHINDLEKEANLKGTMTFRNWTDSLQEDGQKTSDKNMDDYKKQNNPSGKVKDPFGLNQYARELAQGLEEELAYEPLNEEIDLDKYVEDWLGRGGVHDDNSINRVFVSKLKQLGYEDFGTIYRILYIKNAPKTPDLKKHIWTNYNGKYISFSKTLEGAKNFMDQLINDDLLEKGETFVIIKQKSPYYDLSGWVEDKIAEAGGPWAFATVKDYWTEGLYRETQKTQEVLAVLSNNFEIEGRYSKKGKPLTEGRYDKFTNELSRFNQSIKEVGEGSAKTYDWELLQTNPGDYTYGFTTDSGIEYEVNLVVLNYEDDETGEFINGLEIGFSAGEKGEGKSDIEVINKGEVFRVMATIVEIIQFAIKLVPDFKPTNAIIYNPARKKGEGATGNQRDKLYQAYIKKAIPNITFSKEGTAIVGKFDSLKETSYLQNTGVKENDEEMRDALGKMGGKKPVIFCDMDGVLVDFDKGYKELTGVTTHHADSQGRNEFWKLYRDNLKNKDIPEKSYWANLDWMPDGKQLWDYIKEYNPYVLTAPSVNFDLPFEERYKLENNESMQGKTEWVQRLPNMKKLYFRSAQRKADFAGPGKILIDDRKDTIDSWNANGGIGILHTSTANTIKQLQDLGL